MPCGDGYNLWLMYNCTMHQLASGALVYNVYNVYMVYNVYTVYNVYNVYTVHGAHGFLSQWASACCAVIKVISRQ